jgi:hypothetical protein
MLNVVLKLLMLLPFAAIAQPKDVSGWRDIKWGMTVSQAIQSLGAGCAAAPRVRIASPNAPFFGARSHNTYEEPAAWVRQCKIAQAPYPSYDGEVEHASVSRITLAGYTGWKDEQCSHTWSGKEIWTETTSAVPTIVVPSRDGFFIITKDRPGKTGFQGEN